MISGWVGPRPPRQRGRAPCLENQNTDLKSGFSVQNIRRIDRICARIMRGTGPEARGGVEVIDSESGDRPLRVLDCSRDRAHSARSPPGWGRGAAKPREGRGVRADRYLQRYIFTFSATQTSTPMACALPAPRAKRLMTNSRPCKPLGLAQAAVT